MDFSIQIPEQIGPLLKSRRKAMGLTQKQAGERVGLLQKTVSSMENTPSVCSVTTFYKLLSSLGLEIVLREKNRNLSDVSRDQVEMDPDSEIW